METKYIPPFESDRALVEHVGERLHSQFDYEACVSHEWLMEQFGIETPAIPAGCTYKDAESLVQQVRLRYTKLFQALSDYMLEKHQKCLKSKQTYGYTVVHPDQQAKIAIRDLEREMAKAIVKGAKRVAHTNTALLSSTAQSEHHDAIARLGQLRAMMASPRRLRKLERMARLENTGTDS